ncbi:hypothetical protein [Kitasatospora purpeofusca]|uniref:hypothetical protein n=1 Tax=Kitasatospora purpeofusca TaxID=67352 RepID=UPI000B21EA38|nr:hypothetical protein [Kitasatospora purpeofusca]
MATIMVERYPRAVPGFRASDWAPDMPHGCLSVNTVHACAPDSEPVRQEVIARRMAGEAALRRRFEQAADLPADCDPRVLAQLVHTVTDGIAVQAASGRTRDQLHQVADLALRTLFQL